MLLGVADTITSAALSEAVQAEGVCAKFFSNIDEARTLIAKDRPSLTIPEHDPPRINGMDMCRAICRQANDDEHDWPWSWWKKRKIRILALPPASRTG